jgi:phage baseplate assembly protein W
MTAILRQEFKQYSFKSVGQTLKSRQDRSKTILNRPRPIGIATPVTLDYGAYAFVKMHTDVGDQVTDNFRQLILTNHGDRLGLYDFGANLLELTFEMQAEEVQGEAMRRISKAAAKYMPFIELDTFESFIDHFENQDIGKVGIRLGFNVPKLNITNRRLEILLYVAG